MNIDLKTAFPAMEDREYHALMDAARSVKEEKTMKRKLPKAILIFAVVTLLMATVAVAEGLGMFDFLQQSMGTKVLPGATSAANIATHESDYVTFTIAEAAFDGRGMSVMVRITPKDDKTFIMGDGGWMDDDPAFSVTSDESLEDVTIAEYMEMKGYERSVTAGVEFDVPGGFYGLEDWQDGVLTTVYQFYVTGETVEVPYTCWSHLRGNPESTTQTGTITLKAEAPLWTAQAEGAEVPFIGMRIDRIDLTGTRLGMYADIHLTVTDLEKAQGWIDFRLLDENGVELRPGATSAGAELARPEALGEQLVTSHCIQAVQTAPDVLYLEVRDIRNDVETVLTLPVIPN